MDFSLNLSFNKEGSCNLTEKKISYHPMFLSEEYKFFCCFVLCGFCAFRNFLFFSSI